MATVRLKIDHSALDAAVTRLLGNDPRVKEAAEKQFLTTFHAAKQSMLQQFDAHNVTVELLQGPRAVNISRTLDGYGNLFAFIGFYEHTKPTEALRELLMGISGRPTVYRDRKWYFRVDIPTDADIAAATPMPWERGSWALQVERAGGISGLSHFLYKKWRGLNSRSGMGMQLPYEYLEDISFKPVPYLSEILGHFRERLNNK
jgi:hypothetical protein